MIPISAIHRLFLQLLAWTVSTFWESRHDFRLERHLYRLPRLDSNNFNQPDSADLVELNSQKNKLKAEDGLEKLAFLLVLAALEGYWTGNWWYAVLDGLWQSSLRWVGHEAWLSLWTGRALGRMGTSSSWDKAVTKLNLGETGNACLMVAIPTLLTLVILYFSLQF